MRPVKLIIRRKVVVPRKVPSAAYQTKIDWYPIMSIEYSDSINLFKTLNSNASLQTDAQFAYFIFQRFGEGEYSVMAFRKGRKGLWSFMRVFCNEEGFMRIQRKQNSTDREREQLITEWRKLKRTALRSEDIEHKRELAEEMEEIQSDLEFNKNELQPLEGPSKSGCYPYLLTTHPIFKFHEYQSIEDINIYISKPFAEDKMDFRMC